MHLANADTSQIAYIRRLWPRQKIIVYDLGLSSSSAENLKGKCLVEVRKFPFDKYPTYVDRLLEYRWKPLLIAVGFYDLDIGYNVPLS
ncbi:hypothetical protein ANCCAN_26079 [Ancylostoma caninum]|uniref:Uncharacterized protein n=1 Tax=Ancylostoma caninum TaxID=29170 RepID=A0A368F7P7_ANCCA|nr:hypothetical protein ANCCAN_26079 [Ancylostoma caninum]